MHSKKCVSDETQRRREEREKISLLHHFSSLRANAMIMLTTSYTLEIIPKNALQAGIILFYSFVSGFTWMARNNPFSSLSLFLYWHWWQESTLTFKIDCLCSCAQLFWITFYTEKNHLRFILKFYKNQSRYIRWSFYMPLEVFPFYVCV